MSTQSKHHQTSYWDAFALQQKDHKRDTKDASSDKKQLNPGVSNPYIIPVQRKQRQSETTPSLEEPQAIRRSLSDLYALQSLPRNTLLSTRDFIHTSLYHPEYGYFSKQATIFSPENPIPFMGLQDSVAFQNYVSGLYEEMEADNATRQVWHTPTELFKPWYGYAVAEYMIQRTRQDNHPLIIYEIGAGNGTLMRNIMDYVSKHAPDLYAQAQYNIIEIASPLATKQTFLSTPHKNKVNVIHQSILEWNRRVDEPCFVMAMEVIDNFSHDLIRFDMNTGEPLQGLVVVDELGDYKEAFEPVSDPVLLSYLKERHQLGISSRASLSPTKQSLVRLANSISSVIPLPIPAMTRGEFLPTMTFSLLQVLRDFFPRHKLILSDFDTLPDTVPGYLTAPVAQTRYKGNMIACSTYLVQPGWFDLFFPTNFQELEKMYSSMMNTVSSESLSDLTKKTRILSHKAFCQEYGKNFLKETTLRNGENPMLSFYENMRFLVS